MRQAHLVGDNAAADTAEQEIGALVCLTGDIEAQHVAEALRHTLPSYMVPTRIIVESGEFPRTPNGKYDRKAITRLVFDQGAG